MRVRGSLSFLRRIVASKMAAVHNRGQSGEDNLTDIKITIHVALNFLPSSVIFRGIVYVQEIFVSWRENARIHDGSTRSPVASVYPQKRETLGATSYLYVALRPGVSTAMAKSVNASSAERNRDTSSRYLTNNRHTVLCSSMDFPDGLIDDLSRKGGRA